MRKNEAWKKNSYLHISISMIRNDQSVVVHLCTLTHKPFTDIWSHLCTLTYFIKMPDYVIFLQCWKTLLWSLFTPSQKILRRSLTRSMMSSWTSRGNGRQMWVFQCTIYKTCCQRKIAIKKKKSNSVQMPYRASIYTLLIFLIYQNVMILGDFNADGSYVSKKDMKEIRIRSDKNFHWLISDDVDTTVNKGNDNTYDRWVTQILLDVYYYCYTNIAPISCHPSLWYPF